MNQPELVKLMLAQRSRLTGYAWSIVRDLDQAEDIIQDVFVIAIQKSEEINDSAHLDLWLRKAIRFQSLSLLRKRSGDTQVEDDLLAVIDTAFHDRDERGREDERLEALANCLAKLTPKTRMVLEMRYGRGLACGSIAEHVHRQVETVYQMIARAHRSLKECVQQQMVSSTN